MTLSLTVIVCNHLPKYLVWSDMLQLRNPRAFDLRIFPDVLEIFPNLSHLNWGKSKEMPKIGWKWPATGSWFAISQRHWYTHTTSYNRISYNMQHLSVQGRVGCIGHLRSFWVCFANSSAKWAKYQSGDHKKKKQIRQFVFFKVPWGQQIARLSEISQRWIRKVCQRAQEVRGTVLLHYPMPKTQSLRQRWLNWDNWVEKQWQKTSVLLTC